MSRPRLAVAAGFAALTAFASVSLPLAPARAAATPVSRAADYIVANWKSYEPYPGATERDAGADMDALMGVVAAGPAYTADAKTIYASTKAECGAAGDPDAYQGAPSGASKCALAATIMGDTATAAADLAPWTSHDYSDEYEFGAGLEAISFERAKIAVPQSLVNRIVQLYTVDPKTGTMPIESPYGYQLDATGNMLVALENLPNKTAATNAALANATKYVLDHQDKTTHLWPDFTPTNTTGMVGPAVARTGADGKAAFALAQQAMIAVQNQDGSFDNRCGDANAPSGRCGVASTGHSDLRATNQAIFALANVTMYDLSAVPAPTPTPTPTSTPTPMPTTTAKPQAAVLTVATAADCAGQGGVWVVVENRGTPTRRGCVKLSGGATALDALKALTPNVQTKTSSYGQQICTIDNLGTCDWDPKTQLYWSFWASDAVAAPYGYAKTGADANVPAPGSSVAFDWNTGTAPAAAQGMDTPLPVVTAQPTPPSSSTPTQTASATASPAPDAPGLANTGGSQVSVLLIGLIALSGGAVALKRK